MSLRAGARENSPRQDASACDARGPVGSSCAASFGDRDEIFQVFAAKLGFHGDDLRAARDVRNRRGPCPGCTGSFLNIYGFAVTIEPTSSAVCSRRGRLATDVAADISPRRRVVDDAVCPPASPSFCPTTRSRYRSRRRCKRTTTVRDARITEPPSGLRCGCPADQQSQKHTASSRISSPRCFSEANASVVSRRTRAAVLTYRSVSSRGHSRWSLRTGRAPGRTIRRARRSGCDSPSVCICSARSHRLVGHVDEPWIRVLRPVFAQYRFAPRCRSLALAAKQRRERAPGCACRAAARDSISVGAMSWHSTRSSRASGLHALRVAHEKRRNGCLPRRRSAAPGRCSAHRKSSRLSPRKRMNVLSSSPLRSSASNSMPNPFVDRGHHRRAQRISSCFPEWKRRGALAIRVFCEAPSPRPTPVSASHLRGRKHVGFLGKMQPR